LKRKGDLSTLNIEDRKDEETKKHENADIQTTVQSLN
jgi:hypothetical protein